MIWTAACFLALGAAAPSPVVMMVDQPVTVAVPITEQVRKADAVVLRMEGILVRRDAAAMWNVFWEMPQANKRSSVDDLHFAGYISLPANTALRDVKPTNAVLPMPAAAVAAIHTHNTLRLTFVPVRKLPEGGVAITSLRLE